MPWRFMEEPKYIFIYALDGDGLLASRSSSFIPEENLSVPIV
jgi:hypothetical protein